MGKKAYDSIEVLVKLKINPQIIDLIVQMYEGDSTIIQLGRMKKSLEVTGGITQGCCISTLLFKMVTFTMIEDLRKLAEKYKVGEFMDNSLWLAGDATLIADSLPNLLKLLEVLEKTGELNGLKINLEKTKIMRVRGPEIGDKVGELEVVKETKYLGVQVGGRNIFEMENKKLLEKAEEKVNALLAQIKKSADKVIVGKATWKLMAIPAILFGRAVITTNKAHIEKLQRLENKVWRYLLGIGGYAAIEALRGEIGASMVKSRIMETMLAYVVDTLAGKFQEVKKMMLHTITKGKGRWYKAINEYSTELNLSWDDLKELDKTTLKSMIKSYDTDKWEEGMTRKVSLRYYIQEKKKIKYEHCYRNNRNSLFLARVRTNTIKLEDHKGRGLIGYDKTCKLCREDKEDIVHFIIDCKKLEKSRDYNLIDENIHSSEEKMSKLLFRNNKHQEIGKMIKNLWTDMKKFLDINKEKHKDNYQDFTN